MPDIGLLDGSLWHPEVAGVSGSIVIEIPTTREFALEGELNINGGFAVAAYAASVVEIIGLEGSLVIQGDIDIVAVQPRGAFTDFSVHHPGDVDPLQAIITEHNAREQSATTGSYSQHWAIVVPPRESFIQGESLWPRAAYAMVGIEFAEMAPDDHVYIDGAMVEVVGRDTNLPSTYRPARAINSRVRADRMNYAENPTFAASLDKWQSCSKIEYDLNENLVTNPSAEVGLEGWGNGVLTWLEAGDLTWDQVPETLTWNDALAARQINPK